MAAAPEPPGADSCAHLLARVAAGDRAAFRPLYDLTAPRLYAIALRLLRRSDLAEEAVQECYLRVWRHAARFDPARGAPLAWMATIQRRVALDRLPPQRALAPLEEAERLAATVTPPSEPRLGGCLGGLPIEQREAVLLTYVEGLTHQELAGRLAIPLGTAKSRVRRGLIALRACLEAT
jgi:RNA polymerase sigma-70 factor (ECF subfamily)